MTDNVEGFFDDATHTISYVLTAPAGNSCAVIDPVMDFDAASGRASFESADRIISHIKERGLQLEWILETHIHADHLSSARYIRSKLGGQIATSSQVGEIQAHFKPLFDLDDAFATDGRQFDRLFDDGDRFMLDGMEVSVLHTPGHTPACVTYLAGDAAFVGDTLFMPDFGTARTDFPGGDAATLYQSIQRIFSLPPDTRVFTCHDYKPKGRDEFVWESTVAQQRAENIHVKQGVSEAEFIAFRLDRDAGLSMPALILPALQVNIRGGDLPAPDDNGIAYLKIPLNRF